MRLLTLQALAGMAPKDQNVCCIFHDWPLLTSLTPGSLRSILSFNYAEPSFLEFAKLFCCQAFAQAFPSA